MHAIFQSADFVEPTIFLFSLTQVDVHASTWQPIWRDTT